MPVESLPEGSPRLEVFPANIGRKGKVQKTMAQEKPDFLKALEQEMRRDEAAQPKAGAAGGGGASAAHTTKPASPQKSSLLDSLLSDARAEANREIQQHKDRLDEKVSGQRRADEEEERRKRLQYEQLFEQEKNKRLDSIRKKEEEKAREKQDILLAEQRRIAAIAKAEVDKKSLKVRIYVGSATVGVLAVCAILVFARVIPLLPSDEPTVAPAEAKSSGYVPPPPFQGVSFSPVKGSQLFQLGEKPAFSTVDGAGIQVLDAVRASGFRVDSYLPPRTLDGSTEPAEPETRLIAELVTKNIKVERKSSGGSGEDNGISVNPNVFGGP